MSTLKIMGKEFTKDGKVITECKTFKIKSTELMQFSLKDLAILDHNERCKNTSMPPAYVPINKFTDATANGLTQAICRFINLQGYQAERISSTGRYIDNTKIVTDCLGYQRKIGSGKYIKGSGTKGTADISATIKGLSIKIEVKMKDKQSDVQKEYQASIERAGGKYWLVYNWQEFIIKYNSL